KGAAAPIRRSVIDTPAAAVVVGAAPISVPRAGAAESIAALPADGQAVQQIARPRQALTPALAVFGQLLLDAVEQLTLDQGRHGDPNPLLRRRQELAKGAP